MKERGWLSEERDGSKGQLLCFCEKSGFRRRVHLTQCLNDFFVFRCFIQRISLAESDLPIFGHDEHGAFIDSGNRRTVAKNAISFCDLPVRKEVTAQGKVSEPDAFLLPCDVTRYGVTTYAQNLGIECGEPDEISIERRHLRGSSRRPVQRMKCQHHALSATIVAEPHLRNLFPDARRQLKIRRHLSYRQGGHGSSLAVKQVVKGTV